MKNKISYKWLALPMLMMVISFSACKKDFLDRKPLGRYTDEDIPAGSYDSKVFAAYAILRKNGFNDHLYLGIHSYRADEAIKGSTEADGAVHGEMYDNFQYDATNAGIATYWTHHYELIIAANEIIADIDSLGLNEPAALINKAEAKFLRAFAYFDLVRTFGEVPLVDFKIYSAGDVNVPKAPVNQIFQLIDADLTEAAAVLPLQWEPQYIGRLTSGAANALHARTYLWRKDWPNALAKATAVINSEQYSLVPNFGSQFRKNGENGPESIFEIQAYYSPTLNLGIIYANVQGVRGAGQWDLGWGWNTPSAILEAAFEPGDPRKIETLLYTGQTDPLYGETVPAGLARPYWNKKIYTDPADRLALNNRFGRWMNHRIIRYADVLLMAAEAANEIGGPDNTQKALEWLEMVRARARGNNASILPPVTTTNQAELRDAIRHERMVELAMEEQRFYDLVRWEIDVDVLHAAGHTNYEVKHRLLPIPQAEIDKSGGILVQNPDWQ